MDGFEIVAPEASGEAIFSGFTLKSLLAFKIDKMITRGRLSIHLQEAPKLSKEWGEGQGRLVMFSCRTRGFCPSCHAKRINHPALWGPDQSSRVMWSST